MKAEFWNFYFKLSICENVTKIATCSTVFIQSSWNVVIMLRITFRKILWKQNFEILKKKKYGRRSWTLSNCENVTKIATPSTVFIQSSWNVVIMFRNKHFRKILSKWNFAILTFLWAVEFGLCQFCDFVNFVRMSLKSELLECH